MARDGQGCRHAGPPDATDAGVQARWQWASPTAMTIEHSGGAAANSSHDNGSGAQTAIWTDAAAFRREQGRLERLVGARFGRALSDADVEEVVADALLQRWRYADRVERPSEWLSQVAINGARRRIVRNKHGAVTPGHVTDLLEGAEGAAPLAGTAATLSAGRQALARDLTAEEVERRDTVAARAEVVCGLARIRPLDVGIYLDIAEGGYSHAEVRERRGASGPRVRKAVRRVSRFLERVGRLADAGRLGERDAVAVALCEVGLATPAETERARSVLARPDGREIAALLRDALRLGATFPLLPGVGAGARLGAFARSAREHVSDVLVAAKLHANQLSLAALEGSRARPGAAVAVLAAAAVAGTTVSEVAQQRGGTGHSTQARAGELPPRSPRSHVRPPRVPSSLPSAGPAPGAASKPSRSPDDMSRAAPARLAARRGDAKAPSSRSDGGDPTDPLAAATQPQAASPSRSPATTAGADGVAPGRASEPGPGGDPTAPLPEG